MNQKTSEKIWNEIINILLKYKVKPFEAIALLELLKLTIWQSHCEMRKEQGNV